MNIEQLICSICLAAQQNPFKLEQCAHSFCSDCILQWLDVKNNCPLCLNFIGNDNHNRLLVRSPEQTQFDYDNLSYQNELKQIEEKMQNLEKRIDNELQYSKNFRSQYIKTSLFSAKDQMTQARNHYNTLQQSILLNDTASISVMIQLITELFIHIENVLNQEQDSDEEYFDEVLQDYLVGQNQKKEKARQKLSTGRQNAQIKQEIKQGKIIKN